MRSTQLSKPEAYTLRGHAWPGASQSYLHFLKGIGFSVRTEEISISCRVSLAPSAMLLWRSAGLYQIPPLKAPGLEP